MLSLETLLELLAFAVEEIEETIPLYNSVSLLSLPDISKWNTSNVNEMNSMFSKCNSLISLPDISKWNTSNVTDMSDMFN